MEYGLNEYNIDESGDIQLSQHFKLSEFQCHDGSFYVRVHGQLIEKLEQLRNYVASPIRINSGYRTPSYNDAIGGAKYSQHKEGTAVDITIDGLDVGAIAELGKAMGFNGIGIYDTFVHLDVRQKEATWDYRS